MSIGELYISRNDRVDIQGKNTAFSKFNNGASKIG